MDIVKHAVPGSFNFKIGFDTIVGKYLTSGFTPD
jgi:hypothetical protein